MRKIVIGLVLFTALLLFSATNKQEKQYISKNLGISVLVPKTWEIFEDSDSSLLSIYSPETKEHPDKTLDLERGLKMELSIIPNEKNFIDLMSGVKAEKFFTLANPQGKNALDIYLEKGSYGGAELICLHALIKGKNKDIWAVGYIPEKERFDKYAEKFSLLISTIKFN